MNLFATDIWDENRFPGFVDHMNQLYDVSRAYYEVAECDSETAEDDIAALNTAFHCLEFYFVSLLRQKYITNSNLKTAMEQLMSIRLFKVLDPKLRKRINGITYNKVIAFSPTPGCFANMDQASSFQISLCHELGHILVSCNEGNIQALIRFLGSEENSKNLKDGFDVLEEVVSQNMSEAVYYDRIFQERPPLEAFSHPLLYPKGRLFSNFCEYKEFQELAVDFAKCLSFLDCCEDDFDTTLQKLSKAMISKDFGTKFYNEFALSPEKKKDIATMLLLLGRIKNAKYSIFGLGNVPKEELDMTNVIAEFKVLAEKNKVVPLNNREEKVQG